MHCAIENRRLSYDYVYNYFRENGCELLTQDYKNSREKLTYKCVCGNVDKIGFEKFKIGRRCRQCSIKKANHSGIKIYYEDVKKFVENEGYILHTTEENYQNFSTKIKLECENGHRYEATFKNFKKGRRCPHCKLSSGERLINQYLLQRDVIFIPQYEFPDLMSPRGFPLRFDFVILNRNKEILSLIEFDGIFHFKKVHEGARLDIQIRYDLIKNKYCIKNNLPLFRIPFIESGDMEYILDQILLFVKDKENTDSLSEFIVTGNWNHKEYMKKVKNKLS